MLHAVEQAERHLATLANIAIKIEEDALQGPRHFQINAPEWIGNLPGLPRLQKIDTQPMIGKGLSFHRNSG
jgi:hypothetical protein